MSALCSALSLSIKPSLTSQNVFIIAVVTGVMGVLCVRQIVETPGHPTTRIPSV